MQCHLRFEETRNPDGKRVFNECNCRLDGHTMEAGFESFVHHEASV